MPVARLQDVVAVFPVSSKTDEIGESATFWASSSAAMMADWRYCSSLAGSQVAWAAGVSVL